MLAQPLVTMVLTLGCPLVLYCQYKYRKNDFVREVCFNIQMFVLGPLGMVSLFHLLTGTHF